MADHAKDAHDDHAPHEVMCSTYPIYLYCAYNPFLFI
jgi:hypothetical protein